MASQLASSMKIWVSHIESWVAEQEDRNRKRKIVINDAKSDPKAAREALEAQLVEVGEVERGMQRLQDALKNAEPALDKLRSQAKKDEQMMLALLAGGGGAGEALTQKTPFVRTMVASVDPIADKARQALIDVNTLMEQMRRDQVLTDALGGRSDLDSVIKLLNETAEQVKHTRESSSSVGDALLRRLD